MLTSLFTSTLAAAEPAGGAALDQVALATAMAAVVTGGLLWLALGHRNGSVQVLDRLATFSGRVGGLPGWAALPSAITAISLVTALLGMFWDIALHIGEGRDEGPLANPAHYLILAGLFGVFSSGVIACVLPRGERPGPAAVRLQEGWHAPVGGLLLVACGAFSLSGFPLDDVWHRLFGQDVTLWGPTHLMLLGGAGLSLVAQAVLLAEGIAHRRARPVIAEQAAAARRERPTVVAVRRVALMGGLLIGLSIFQAEFDFGVPQYRMVAQPVLLAMAAGTALVAGRLWIGRGGALATVAFYLVVRGTVSVIVGPVLGETTPSLPLYLGAAVVVEVAALALARRGTLTFGAAGGFLAGTAGLALEWPWIEAALPLDWTADVLPEGLLLGAVAGTAGGVLGALLAEGLRGRLPRPAVARALTIGSMAAIAGAVAFALPTSAPQGARAAITLDEVAGGASVDVPGLAGKPGDATTDGRAAQVTARIEPASLARDASWVTVTSWQDGGLVVEPLRRVGEGLYRSDDAVPLDGEWKTVLRVQDGRQVIGVPLWLPADPAIPAPEVPAPQSFTRAFEPDVEILQRERDFDVAGWLWGGASAVVLALYAAILAALSWGVARLGRRLEGDPSAPAGAPADGARVRRDQPPLRPGAARPVGA